MATNSGGWLYEANGTPVDKATADNAQARVLEVDGRSKAAVDASAEAKAAAAQAQQTANSYAGQIAQSNTTAGSAVAIANEARGTVEAIEGPISTRLGALEIIGGLEPGDVSDATVQNLIAQEGTGTRAALNAQSVQAAKSAEVAQAAKDPAAEWGGVLMQNYAQADGTVNAHDKRLGTPGTRAAFINALDAAESAGRGTVVRLGRGVTDVGTGLSMSGRSALIQGTGAFTRYGTAQSGSVLHASQQAGPVLDLKGWIQPDQFRGRVRMGDFILQGSGVADPTKANSGLEMDYIGSTLLHDIAITDTGGPGIIGADDRPGYGQYLSDFERITVTTPVGAYTNDVPYVELTESNCNRWRGIGLRSVSLPPAGQVARDVGPSGAVRIISPNRPTDPFSSVASLYDAWWFENLHVPAGGTLVHVESRLNVFADFQFIDCWKEPDADDYTSYFRFRNNPATLQGGNEVRGHIPGRNPDYPDTNANGYHSIDYGVDMGQSYNYVNGVKGRNGYNVLLRSAINANVHLGGSSFATDKPAVIQEGTASTGTVIVDGSSAVRSQQGWKTISADASIKTVQNLAASYTMKDTDYFVTINGGAHTVTLLDPTNYRGREFIVKNLSTSAVTVVSAGTSKTIDGAVSKALAQYETLRVMSNGTMWTTV